MAALRRSLAPQLLDWVGADRLELIDVGSGWPSRFDCKTPSGVVRVAAHLGPITLSKRDRDGVERRFQNPGKNHPVVALKAEYPVLLGMTEINHKPVIVGMDGVKRLGKTTRQSLFMRKTLLPAGINQGWAEQANAVGERIIAFVPPLLPFFIDVYRTGRTVSKAEIRAALKDAGVKPLPPDA